MLEYLSSPHPVQGNNYEIRHGHLYFKGANWFGRFGLPMVGHRYSNLTQVPDLDHVIAVKTGWKHTVLLTASGEVYGAGSNRSGQLGFKELQNVPTFTRIPLTHRVVALSAGENHSLFLTARGHVYGCGSNKDGQLFLPDSELRNTPTRILTPKRVVRVDAGMYLSKVWTSSGRVYTSTNIW